MLRAGLPVKDKHIVFSDSREFITTLQANVEKLRCTPQGTGQAGLSPMRKTVFYF